LTRGLLPYQVSEKLEDTNGVLEFGDKRTLLFNGEEVVIAMFKILDRKPESFLKEYYSNN